MAYVYIYRYIYIYITFLLHILISSLLICIADLAGLRSQLPPLHRRRRRRRRSSCSRQSIPGVSARLNQAGAQTPHCKLHLLTRGRWHCMGKSSRNRRTSQRHVHKLLRKAKEQAQHGSRPRSSELIPKVAITLPALAACP